MGNINIIDYDSDLTETVDSNSKSSNNTEIVNENPRKGMANKILGSIMLSSVALFSSFGAGTDINYPVENDLYVCNNLFGNYDQIDEDKIVDSEINNFLKIADIDKLFNSDELNMDFLSELENNPISAQSYLDKLSENFINSNVDLEEVIKANRYGNTLENEI